ncbi:MAG: hypothetical protein LUQ38_00095 [Methanotrichaceae archaeon]|nr:hypothetical protein [Methanotrichaceae archaeon]
MVIVAFVILKTSISERGSSRPELAKHVRTLLEPVAYPRRWLRTT